MKFELITKVVLTVDPRQNNLRHGQIGIIVECYPMLDEEDSNIGLEGLIEQDVIAVSESQISMIFCHNF